MRGWIGVDLDGTLAEYDHWRGEEHIGAPIPAMVGRVQGWIAEGEEVRIFTARASLHGRSVEQRQANVARIKAWCVKHIGRVLDVTSDKDWGMKELWDDRAVQVAVNTGRSISEMPDARIRDSQPAAILTDEPKEREVEGPQIGDVVACRSQDNAGYLAHRWPGGLAPECYVVLMRRDEVERKLKHCREDRRGAARHEQVNAGQEPEKETP